MKKNDLTEIEITGITAEGSGVGKADGMAIFVPQTAVGDVAVVRAVKVKKNYAFGKLEELKTPSPDRIAPDCAAFRFCGGCVFRHLNYAAECAAKQTRVRDAVQRIGGVSTEPNPILSATETERYRNKAQYPITADGKFGFFATHSHRVIPCGDCLLQPEVFTEICAAVEKWIAQTGVSVYDETTHTGLLRHLYLRLAPATGEVMTVLVINGEHLPFSEKLVERLCAAVGENLKSVQVNINRDNTNVVLGKRCEVLYGAPYITDILCGVKVRLSPLSFYQVNRDMAEILYRKAAEYADADGKDILDLYCGAGTIGLSMARRAKSVIGVEIVEQAVKDARVNAAENGIENARFICADAAEAARQLANEKIHPQVVIVDPPRKGCSEDLLKTVAEDFSPERLVYVSCDPATLARDIAVLEQLGYRLIEYTPVDLFPRTGHVESVVLMSRA